MQHRVGLCSSCGASFKVPASFSADKAKCKVCSGVVNVGPVRSDAQDARSAPPIPARGPAARSAPTPPRPAPPRPEPAPAPAKPKREGPSMKERLLAERQAQAGPASASPSAIPTRSATQGRPAATGKPLQVGAAPRVRAIADPPLGKVGRASEPAAAGRASAGARRRGGRREDAGEEVVSERGGRARGRGRQREKQSPALLLTAVGLIVVAGAAAGGWFYFMGGADEPATGEDGSSTVQAGAPTEGAAAADTPAQKTGGTGAEPILPEGAPGAEAAPAEEPKVAARAPRTAAEVDPALVDLSAIEDFAAPQGTDADEWKRVRDLVATALDSESGVLGTRAQRELEQLGKPAFAALVNAMTEIDYSTEQGYRDGDIAQRILRTISNGSNFEWRYSTEPKDVYFNKRVVESWAKVWARARTDDAYWRTFTKQTAQPEAEGEAPPLPASDLDDLDDL